MVNVDESEMYTKTNKNSNMCPTSMVQAIDVVEKNADDETMETDPFEANFSDKNKKVTYVKKEKEHVRSFLIKIYFIKDHLACYVFFL